MAAGRAGVRQDTGEFKAFYYQMLEIVEQKAIASAVAHEPHDHYAIHQSMQFDNFLSGQQEHEQTRSAVVVATRHQTCIDLTSAKQMLGAAFRMPRRSPAAQPSA